MNKIRTIIYLCLFAGAFLISGSSCKQKTDEKSEEAELPLDSVATENRLKELNDLIGKNPEDANAYFSRSQIFSQRNIIQQAYFDATKATQLDSTKPEYFLHLADICFRGLQIPKAISAFEKCLQLDPKNLEANLKLSELYMYLKAYPKSIQYANDALRIDDKKAKAYFIKGFVYKESGDTSRAISSFSTAIEVDPDNYDSYIQLGLIYGARGNDLAIQYYTNALRLRPSSEEALYNRGFYYQETGKLEKAEEDYRTILSKNSNHSEAYYNLGFIALVNKENYPEAIKQFSSAIRANQNYVEAFYNRGMAYESTGDITSAIKDYRSALAIFPNYGLALDRLKELGQ